MKLLRCTVAGMLPLLKSQKYAHITDDFFGVRANDIYEIETRKLYYLIPWLPHQKAKNIMQLLLPEVVKKQKKNGLWGVKDAGFHTYCILEALDYTDLLDEVELNNLKNTLKDDYDYYALLTKKMLHSLLEKDLEAINNIIQEDKGKQEKNGSWGNTVVETVYYLNRLLKLGIAVQDLAMKQGIEFLFSCYNIELDALHTKDPYGLKIKGIFTSDDRQAEFEAAERYFPELLPRSKCFRHIAIIQHSLCINFLIQIGMENDQRTEQAMDSVYGIFKEYNGLCDSDVKRKYLQSHKK